MLQISIYVLSWSNFSITVHTYFECMSSTVPAAPYSNAVPMAQEHFHTQHFNKFFNANAIAHCRLEDPCVLYAFFKTCITSARRMPTPWWQQTYCIRLSSSFISMRTIHNKKTRCTLHSHIISSVVAFTFSLNIIISASSMFFHGCTRSITSLHSCVWSSMRHNPPKAHSVTSSILSAIVVWLTPSNRIIPALLH